MRARERGRGHFQNDRHLENVAKPFLEVGGYKDINTHTHKELKKQTKRALHNTYAVHTHTHTHTHMYIYL